MVPVIIDAVKTGAMKRVKFDWLWLIIGLAVVIRLIFLGLINLLPEEAYYWNYAAHLDIGYLDHPPLTAWSIFLSEAIFGKSEFAVRFPAFLGWFLMAYFMYRFAENTIGKVAGKIVLLLLALLPIYMSVGFLMTPDAPLYAFWAGALFFLERAIIGERRSAWFGAGICLGLGLLSKYTMVLIIPAALIYLFVDKKSRQWLLRPYPYLALLIGLIFFFPVLYWNWQHHWASFTFQGTQRWTGGLDFQLHILIGSVLILLTPLGLFDAIRSLFGFWKNRMISRQADQIQFRKKLFLAIFTLVPLAVFVIQSIQGQPKLNWTGPVWMAILPLIAVDISGFGKLVSQSEKSTIALRWSVNIAGLLIFYTVGFGYLVIGMPGMAQTGGMKFPIAWKMYGERVEKIESKLEMETGSEPIIIGMDKYWLASEASFYDVEDSSVLQSIHGDRSLHDNDRELLPEVAGENLVGGNSLMWNFWISPQMTTGRNAVLVSFNREKLEKSWVMSHFTKLSEISREMLMENGREIGLFYWRTGYNYSPKLSGPKDDLKI
jgi:dolichol-phosphate mannosyltransferase